MCSYSNSNCQRFIPLVRFIYTSEVFIAIYFCTYGITIIEKANDVPPWLYSVNILYQRKHFSTETTYTTTYTEAISTGTAYPYVSTQGDVYVGTSTNILFGICRYLHTVKQGDSYALTVEDAQSLGSSVASTFMYSQYELQTVMIPKWKDQRNAFMKTAQVVADSTAAYAYKNTGNHGVYLTWANPDDKDYGIHRYR